jgi:hypothetical protein
MLIEPLEQADQVRDFAGQTAERQLPELARRAVLVG